MRTLFDQYAPHFEAALVERLAYRGPALLRAAIERVGRPQPLRIAAALDLGCGTGLAGEMFRPLAAHLTGVDLSPTMIAQARAKNIYDRVEVGDLLPFMAAEAARGGSYDLILAADLCPYVHDLAPLLSAAARVLAAGGLLAFTAETHSDDGVVLGAKLRYAHGWRMSAPRWTGQGSPASISLSHMGALKRRVRRRPASSSCARARNVQPDWSSGYDE